MFGANRIPRIGAKRCFGTSKAEWNWHTRFFTPLGIHLRAALTDLSDKELFAAHRVFAAMIAAMSTFEGELVISQPKPSAVRATAAKDLV